MAVYQRESERQTARTHWLRTRDALGHAATRFSRLLTGIADPSTPALGDWCIREVAAHIGTVSLVDYVAATEAPAEGDLTNLVEEARMATLDTLGDFNTKAVEREQERDLAVLARQVGDNVRAVLDETADMDPATERTWVGGLTLPASAIVTHLLSELLVHGYDIARAAGHEFRIADEDAALVFDGFLMPVLRSPQLPVFAGERAGEARPVRAEMRVSGCQRVVITVDQFGLAVREPDGSAVDVRVAARATPMLLVMYRRISPVLPSVRGQVRAWGLRPWRLRRLMHVMELP